MPYKGEALVSHENFCHHKKSVCHLINYIIKTNPSDVESHEEHNETIVQSGRLICGLVEAFQGCDFYEIRTLSIIERHADSCLQFVRSHSITELAVMTIFNTTDN